MAQQNFLWDHGQNCFQSALLRTAPLRTALSWGGARVSMDLCVYLNALGGEIAGSRDNPIHMVIAAGAMVSNDPLQLAERETNIVVQVVGCGYQGADIGELQPILNTMRDYYITQRPRLPVEVLNPLHAIPWMAPAMPERGWPEPTVNEVHTVTEAFAGLGDNRSVVIRVICHGLLAYCKQGSVTNRVINKITDAMREEMGMNIALNANVVRTTWNIIKNWVNPEKMRRFFAIWEDATAGLSLRLNLLINQAQWVGMTNYQNIAKAKNQFPGFPWAGLASIIPGDFANYARAVRSVAGDPYYGYNHDLGDVRSTQYPSLAYAAYTLLRDCGGDRDLSDFQGINNRVPHASTIDALITDFRNTQMETAREQVQNPTHDGQEAAAEFLRMDPVYIRAADPAHAQQPRGGGHQGGGHQGGQPGGQGGGVIAGGYIPALGRGRGHGPPIPGPNQE